MNAKPIRKIAFVDGGAVPEILNSVLPFFENLYDLQFTKSYDADYVFHSCFGIDFLKYKGVRIFVTGENVSPNFNLSDYALAFDPLTYGDRYRQLPLFRVYRESYAALLAPRPLAREVLAGKDSFCAYVMSNTKDSSSTRAEIFEILSTYKPVHSGGKWNNNVGGPVADKIAFQAKHKFVIAFENSSTPGYITEKFAQAAQSDAIPIYWGDPGISKIFNPASFINCHDFPSLEAVLEEVKRIDNDDDLYLKMISEPWFPGGVEPEWLAEKTYVDFFRNILDQDHSMAFRRNLSRWGMKTEKRLFTMAFRPHVQAANLIKASLRRSR